MKKFPEQRGKLMDTETHLMDRIGENTDPADCSSCHVATYYVNMGTLQKYCNKVQ